MATRPPPIRGRACAALSASQANGTRLVRFAKAEPVTPRVKRLDAPLALAIALLPGTPDVAQQPDAIAVALLTGSCLGWHGMAGENSGWAPRPHVVFNTCPVM